MPPVGHPSQTKWSYSMPTRGAVYKFLEEETVIIRYLWDITMVISRRDHIFDKLVFRNILYNVALRWMTQRMWETETVVLLSQCLCNFPCKHFPIHIYIPILISAVSGTDKIDVWRQQIAIDADCNVAHLDFIQQIPCNISTLQISLLPRSFKSKTRSTWRPKRWYFKAAMIPVSKCGIKMQY